MAPMASDDGTVDSVWSALVQSSDINHTSPYALKASTTGDASPFPARVYPARGGISLNMCRVTIPRASNSRRRLASTRGRILNDASSPENRPGPFSRSRMSTNAHTPLLSAVLCIALAGCSGLPPRHISGTLVSPSTGEGLPNQAMVLDRPPGNYTGNPIILFGWMPQQTTIASTTTDGKGNFSFTTTKDRGRYLSILLDWPVRYPSYSVVDLRDSFSPASPLTSFSSDLMHSPDGGFEIRSKQPKDRL